MSKYTPPIVPRMETNADVGARSYGAAAGTTRPKGCEEKRSTSSTPNANRTPLSYPRPMTSRFRLPFAALMFAALMLAAPIFAACADGSPTDMPTCRCGESCAARCGPDGSTPEDGGVLVDARVDAFVPVDAFVGVDAPPPDVPGCVDLDGDRHPAISCGGDDCDDADAMRHPGVLERCQGVDDDCDGDVDEGSFTASFVGAGSTTWTNYELDCTSSAAPRAPIETVIDLESLSRAYFFTAGTYHVLDLLSRTWIASGARSALMPQTAGVTLIGAFTIPAGHAGGPLTVEGSLIASATSVYSYDIDFTVPATPVFRFTVPAPGGANPTTWTPPAGVQTAYLDVSGNWAPDSRAICTTATAAAGPYTAFFTAGRALIDDSGWCFLRIADVPITAFGPFAYATAPARSEWRHTVYNAGVWVFGAPRF